MKLYVLKIWHEYYMVARMCSMCMVLADVLLAYLIIVAVHSRILVYFLSFHKTKKNYTHITHSTSTHIYIHIYMDTYIHMHHTCAHKYKCIWEHEAEQCMWHR